MKVVVIQTTVLLVHPHDAKNIRELCKDGRADGLVYDDQFGLQYYSKAAGAVIDHYLTTEVSGGMSITIEDEEGAKDIKRSQ